VIKSWKGSAPWHEKSPVIYPGEALCCDLGCIVVPKQTHSTSDDARVCLPCCLQRACIWRSSIIRHVSVSLSSSRGISERCGLPRAESGGVTSSSSTAPMAQQPPISTPHDGAHVPAMPTIVSPFCRQCAGKMEVVLMEENTRWRHRCTSCATIEYFNPKLVVRRQPRGGS
jgi:hypothetical protein